jgi:hypothetical protein
LRGVQIAIWTPKTSDAPESWLAKTKKTCEENFAGLSLGLQKLLHRIDQFSGLVNKALQFVGVQERKGDADLSQLFISQIAERSGASGAS